MVLDGGHQPFQVNRHSLLPENYHNFFLGELIKQQRPPLFIAQAGSNSRRQLLPSCVYILVWDPRSRLPWRPTPSLILILASFLLILILWESDHASCTGWRWSDSYLPTANTKTLVLWRLSLIAKTEEISHFADKRVELYWYCRPVSIEGSIRTSLMSLWWGRIFGIWELIVYSYMQLAQFLSQCFMQIFRDLCMVCDKLFLTKPTQIKTFENTHFWWQVKQLQYVWDVLQKQEFLEVPLMSIS